MSEKKWDLTRFDNSVFDKTPDRTSSYAFKWEKYKNQNILPVWVADTEFKCAPAILDALKSRVEHGVLGYTLPAQYSPANEAVKHWCEQEYSWSIDTDWIVWTPGVVPAFNMACQAFCKKGDAVMVQTPNYPPLLAAPSINGLTRISIPTIEVNKRWTIDIAELEKQAARPECKLFIMCNPMNPVGSVLNDRELAQIAKICKNNSVVLCSDEIHCDLILSEECRHTPAGKLDQISDQSVTLMAASKTFNVAGLGTSFAIIPDPKIRTRFVKSGAGIVPWVNILGLIATEAAFTQCKNWHMQELAYLRNNRDYLVAEINAIDGLRALTPEATYLLWVDGGGLDTENPQQWCELKGVGPSPGKDFAEPSFFRINYGCSKAFLQQVVKRLVI